jgi:hypothetical protein
VAAFSYIFQTNVIVLKSRLKLSLIAISMILQKVIRT